MALSRPIREWVKTVLQDHASGVDAVFNSLAVNWVENKHYRETVDTATESGTVSLDISSSNVFKRTLDGDTTFEFTGATSSPSGHSFTLMVEQDSTGGRSITWPSSVEWSQGTTPSLPDGADDKSVVSFITLDSGTTWIGMVGPTAVS
jgi:hypothetical protein